MIQNSAKQCCHFCCFKVIFDLKVFRIGSKMIAIINELLLINIKLFASFLISHFKWPCVQLTVIIGSKRIHKLVGHN